jgi:rhamnose transport system permease protein
MLASYKRELSVAAAYGVLLLAMALFAPAFYAGQFGDTWTNAAPVLVAAVGMTFVVLARQIDISIGSQFAVCGVVAGLAAKAGLPMPGVIALTLAAGVLMGSVNGWLIAFAGLPSIVVTLATMVILRESLRWAREGEAVRDLPAGFQWVGLSQTAGEWLLVGVGVVVLAAAGWAGRYLVAGRAVYAVGSDSEAARLAGVRPKRVTFNVFALMGALVALAALMNAVRMPQIDVNAGLGLELLVIAAVVVGGTAISGGRGTLLGTLAGVMLLVTIGPALTFLRLSAQWERAVQGLIILAAVASDSVQRKGR